EQVEQERPHRAERIRPAQIEQHDGDALGHGAISSSPGADPVIQVSGNETGRGKPGLPGQARQ
ncbi:MAG TPA: hypothetical protein PLR41_09505, partial [Alphaproteobacteria bacterium]|nr:hypothetical protein [Alphaproteobacteria bacterium]